MWRYGAVKQRSVWSGGGGGGEYVGGMGGGGGHGGGGAHATTDRSVLWTTPFRLLPKYAVVKMENTCTK